MKSYLLLTVLLLFIPANLIPQSNNVTKAEKLLNKYSEVGQLNGCVLIAEEENILLAKAYGYGEFDAREELIPNSVFVLASVSKSFTAAGILKLAEMGKLKLDDKVVKYFPELPYPEVAVKHLISNTSGIPEYAPMFIGKWDSTKVAQNKDVINMLISRKPALQFSPGSKFRYSNTGFVLAASIIEKVSGKSFDEFMKEEIFNPAGMHNTRFYTRELEYTIDNFAFPYLKVSLGAPLMIRPETAAALSYLVYLDGIKGDISAASTAEDIYKFDMAMVSGKLIDRELTREAFTPVLNNPDQEKYGYGWSINTNKNGDKIISHEGGMPGISTFNYINLNDQRFIIVLGNTNYTRSAMIAADLARIFEGEEISDPKPFLTLELWRYAGAKGHKGLAEYGIELAKSGNYEISEADINTVGYQVMQQGNLDAAIEIFKLNAELYPDSWNVYDSLAEGYMYKGEKELAIKNYKKSIELNPENENGKELLQKLMNQ